MEQPVCRPESRNIMNIQSGRVRCLAYMACLFTSMIASGILQSFGTFLPYLLDKYGETRSKTSIVHSVLVGVTFSTGFFTGNLIKKVGTGVTTFIGAFCLSGGFIVSYFATGLAMLYATIGVVVGIGSSLTYVSAVVSTGRLFEGRHQTVFLSIQNVAGGVGGIVFPYLFDWLIILYGIHGTFLIIGGTFLNAFACAILLYHTIYVKDIDCDKRVDAFDDKDVLDVVKVTLKSSIFVIMLILVSMTLSNVNGISAILMDFLKFKEMPHSERLVCLVVLNVANTLSRFVPILTNFCTKNPLYTLLISTSLGFNGSLILLFSTKTPLIMVGSAAIGAAQGATLTALSIISFKLFVLKTQPLAYGLNLTVMGFISTGMGPLYGGIYDITQSYVLVLIVSSSVFLLCVICASVCLIMYNRMQSRRELTRTS